MQRVRVKIEGLRDPATAVRIAQMGADAIGLVFAESPRRVTVEAAAAIAAALPPWVATVGVFVDAAPEQINQVVRRTGIQCVQLHGRERPQDAAAVAARFIKAFRVRDAAWIDEVRDWLDGCTPGARPAAVLLDAYDPRAHGGTGKRFNWEMVAQARAAGRLAGVEPIILAGGLAPASAADAVRIVQPWAVDVASGVESAPGVKDLAKVQAFLRAVGGVEPMRTAFWL